MLLFICHVLRGQEAFVPVKSIHFIGLKKTRAESILKFLEFSPSDNLPADKIKEYVEQSSRNLYNTGLFTKVTVQDSLENDSLLVRVFVKERWYIFPQPYFLLEERTFTDLIREPSGKRFTYGMGVDWQNFTGRVDNLWAGFTLGYSKRWFGFYELPFLFGKQKIDGAFFFLYQRNREVNIGSENGRLLRYFLYENDFQTTYKCNLTFTKRLSNIRKVIAEVGYTYKSFHDSLYFFRENYLTNRLGREYYPTFRISYRYDKRDVFAFPLQGYKIYFSFEYNGLGRLSSTNFMKYRMSYSHYYPLTKRWNVSYAGYFYQTMGYKIPYYDKLFLGFGDFLRGYERYVVDGTTLLMGKTDLRFAIIPKRMTSSKKLPGKFRDFPVGLYLVWLNDVGFVHDHSFNNDDPYLKNKLLYSTGIGIQVPFIYDSMFRIEYTYNGLKQRNWFFDMVLPLR